MIRLKWWTDLQVRQTQWEIASHVSLPEGNMFGLEEFQYHVLANLILSNVILGQF